MRLSFDVEANGAIFEITSDPLRPLYINARIVSKIPKKFLGLIGDIRQLRKRHAFAPFVQNDLYAQ